MNAANSQPPDHTTIVEVTVDPWLVPPLEEGDSLPMVYLPAGAKVVSVSPYRVVLEVPESGTIPKAYRS